MVISLGEPYLASRLCCQVILLQRRHETLTHRITDCMPDNERKYWSRSDDVRPHQMLVQTPQKDPNPSTPRHCPDQLSSHSSRPMIPDKLGVLSQAKRNLRLVTCSSSSKPAHVFVFSCAAVHCHYCILLLLMGLASLECLYVHVVKRRHSLHCGRETRYKRGKHVTQYSSRRRNGNRLVRPVSPAL